MTRDSYTARKQIFKCTKYNYLYTSVNTSGSHSTPQGVDGQVDSNRMSVSHKESTVSSAELGGSDTGQLGPTNSTGVSNRSYPHSTSVTYTTSNRSVTRKTCSGDTGGSGIAIQGSNSGEYTISNEFYLLDLPGRKRGGGQRPVINLRALNQYVQVEHFKIEGLHLVPDLLQQRDWMVKMDLKDAYLQIPIHPDHQHLLQFIWGQKHFKFQCLPFGLSSAPRVFTKLLKPVVGFLRQIGLRLIVYLDDMLFMYTYKDQLEAMAPMICKIFEALGLMVNTKKSLLNPTQVVEFLGFQINSLTMTFNLPSEKGRKIQQEAANLLKSQSISARHLAVFIGKVVAASRAITHAPLHYRALQRALNSATSEHNPLECSDKFDSQVTLNSEMITDLHWLSALNKQTVATPVCPPQPVLVIESDASQLGWGARCIKASTGGHWSVEESTHHINYLELLAAFLALKTFANTQKGPILLRMDNISAVTYVN